MVVRLILFGVFILSSLCLHAETLPDPTRPPASLDAGGAAPVVPSGPVVQVIRTLHGKRSALISGQEVVAGSKLGDATVTRIDEDRVELRGPEGLQTLKLFPDVEKRPIVAPPVVAPAKHRKTHIKHRASTRREKAKRKEVE